MADTPDPDDRGADTPAPAAPAGGRPSGGGAARSLAAKVGLRLVQFVATIFVLLYFLFDDLVLAWLRPLFAYVGRLRLFVRLALWMRRRSPYVALLLFAVPFIVLEPFKFGGLLLVGTGHLVSGGITLAASHLLSLLIVERIFHVTEDQLLTIPWFAWAYDRVMWVKDWVYARLRASPAWRASTTLAKRAWSAIHPGVRRVLELARTVAAGGRRLFARAWAARD